MRWENSLWGLRGISLFWLLLAAGGPNAAAESPTLVTFRQGDELITGLRLVNEPHRTVMLGRDGWIYDSNEQPGLAMVGSTDGHFTVLSSPELRGRLQTEFGPAFEVIPTEHYLVVQPRGRGDRWPTGFEKMYRQFVAFMDRRGVLIRRGRFPLVAIVLPDEAAMQAAFAKIAINPGRVAGVYDLSSNRVLLHDRDTVRETAETLRHEAAHQTAYNTGVHSRVSNTPRWIVEGVGSLFEPAIMESARHGTRGDRVNSRLLLHLRTHDAASSDLAHDIQRLVGDDTMFQNSGEVENAYAVGWAMMFYLAEREPRQFASLISHTNRLPPFEKYDRIQRLHDFERIVGADIHRFAKRLERFLESL